MQPSQPMPQQHTAGKVTINPSLGFYKWTPPLEWYLPVVDSRAPERYSTQRGAYWFSKAINSPDDAEQRRAMNALGILPARE